jgi:hypothetical protein
MPNTYAFANNVSTTLAVAINSTATTITLASSANFPVIPAGETWAITLNDRATGNFYEIMYVTAPPSGANLTVLRGQEGTAARAWNVGDYVFAADTAGILSSFINQPYLTTNYGIYNVRTYGAKGNGVADDTAAINLAVAAAQTAGGGIVYFPAGSYVISSLISITQSNIGLLGAGKNVSKLIVSTVGASAVAFTGAPGNFLGNCFMIGLSVWQNNPTGSGAGVSLYYTAVCILQDIQASGFYNGFKLQRATNTYATRCIASFNPTAQYPTAIGWNLNGNSGVGDSGVGGNASSIFVECGADMSPNGAYAVVSTGSVGFEMTGAYCGDITFRDCGTSFAYYGWSIDLTACLIGGSSEDIFIENCTIDYYNVQGILIAGPGDGLSMVNINDGWIDPYPGATNPVGIYCLGVAGVRVRGTQGYQNSFPIQTMVELNGCTDCDIDVQCVGQKYGILVVGSSDCSVGGRFFAPAIAPSTVHVNVTGSARISIKGGSIFDGYATIGAQFDINTTYSVLVGATFNPAHITTPVVNSGTHNQIAKNPGYNPVGNITAPSFPASNAVATNNSGLDLMVLVSCGTGAITAVHVGGVLLNNYTIPVTTLGFPIRLPAGQTISFTYASGSPTWQWFAD